MPDSDRRLLPSMPMLASFEVAARLGSISRTADALNLTQSAVSRQIAHLEEWLGESLFDRAGRRISLNACGQSYLADIAPALAQIRRATRPFVHPPESRVISLATLPSFGMRWLAPRLPRLTKLHGDMVVNISAQADIFDLEREGFDAAIHVGDESWPGAIHDLLFHECAVPVVAPHIADCIRDPEDFLSVPLLVQSERRDAWERWFALAGVDADVPKPQATFSHFLMLAQSVAAGAGAALLPTFLIQDELTSGALVSPIDLPFDEGRSYYLVWPKGKAENPALSAFRSWILDEAAGVTSA